MNKSAFKVICAIFLCSAFSLGSTPEGFVKSRPVGPGVTHHHEYRAAAPWHIHVLEIDLTNPCIHLETVKANNSLHGSERTSSMAARNDREGHRVVGAVNADFYEAGGVPVGAHILQGVLLKKPYPTRSVFSVSAHKVPFIDVVSLVGQIITTDDTSFPITGINVDRGTDALMLYNRYFGATTHTNYWGTEITATYMSDQLAVNDTVWIVVVAKDSVIGAGHGNNSIPTDGIVLSGHQASATFLNEYVFVGDTLGYLLQMPPLSEPLLEMVGGIPRLIRNGVATVEWEAESTSYSFAHNRHPRTAVGFDRDSTRVYFFTVDGRQPGYSVGMSLFELADYLLGWGVYQGVNLDGGGSTTMVVREQVINSPSDAGGERSVANALMIISTASAGPLAILDVEPEESHLIIGSQTRFSVAGFNRYYDPVGVAKESLVWDCNASIGVIDSSGLFTAGQVNGLVGYVYANVGAIRDSALVYITDIESIVLLPNPVVLHVDQQQAVTPEGRDKYGNVVDLSPGDYTWSVTDSFGQISNEGIFRATRLGEGYIIATYHTAVGSTAVTVGETAMVVLDDFSDLSRWNLSSGYITDISSCALTMDDSVFISPPSSARLDYGLTTGGTSALYMECSIPIPGTPDAIGIQVYGDGKGHSLRGLFQDADGEKFLVYFTEALTGIDWSGSWQHLKAPFAEAIRHWNNPDGALTFPVTWKQIYLVETDDAKKDSGTIHLDDLNATYTILKY